MENWLSLGWTISDEIGWGWVFSENKRHQISSWGGENDFSMEILEEFALKKALNIGKKTPD